MHAPDKGLQTYIYIDEETDCITMISELSPRFSRMRIFKNKHQRYPHELIDKINSFICCDN